jgi:hypothetical protein
MHPVASVLLIAASAQPTATPGSAPGPASIGKVAVIGIGACDDARLGRAVRELRAEMRLQLGAAVLSEDETALPAGGLQTATLEEIHGRIIEGRSRFFGLDYGTAEATLRKVMPDIDRLPPGPERWSAASLARIELAHLSMFNQKKPLATEALFEVVRLQEDLTLDRHLYPPLLRDQLEVVRRSVRKARRFRLRVLAKELEQPVYLNGFLVGETPFDRPIVQGSYQVIVGDPTAHSFVRLVELRSDTEVKVEVAREARLKPSAGPCYDYDFHPRPEDRGTAAAILGRALAVDRVALVRLEKLGGLESVAAGLFNPSGQALHDGSLQVDFGQRLRLGRLATFLVTGDSSALEETKLVAPAPLQALSAPPSTPAAQSIVDSKLLMAASPRASPGPGKGPRPLAIAKWATLGIAAAAGVAAGILAISAKSDRDRLADQRTRWPGQVPLSDSRKYDADSDAATRKEQWRNWTASTGAVCAASSAALFVIDHFARQKPTPDHQADSPERTQPNRQQSHALLGLEPRLNGFALRF